MPRAFPAFPHQNVLSASPCRTSSFSFSTFVKRRQYRIDERHLGHLAPSISEFFLPCPFCKCQRRHLTFRSYFVSGDARSKGREVPSSHAPSHDVMRVVSLIPPCNFYHAFGGGRTREEESVQKLAKVANLRPLL